MNPTDAANRAILELSNRKLPPTPANYARMYGAITGGGAMTAAWAPPADTQATRRLASALLRLMKHIEPPVSGMAPLRARERVLDTLVQCEEPGELTAAIEELAGAWQRTTSDSRPAAGSGSGPAARYPSLLVDPDASPDAVIQGIGEVLMLLVGEIEEVLPEGHLDADEFKRLRSLLGGTIDLGRLKDVKDATRSIIIKSGIARYGLSEAKRAVADMLDSLVRRATECEGVGRDFERKLRSHGHAIARTSNLVTFTYGLHDLLAQIDSLTTHLLRTYDGLSAERQRDDEFYDPAQALERDVDSPRMRPRDEAAASVLGRSALEYAYSEELARRADAPGETCLAIIAIDEITKARDDRGDTDAEDAMLQLLVQMVRRTTRTGDVVGRYDQRWIAIILPGTSIEAAQSAMQGLQRSLTSSLYLRYGERDRIMVTFACGVTRVLPGLSFGDVIARASAGLERAQREGRNKVIAV